MSDWIDNLKRREEEEGEIAARKAAIRLHDAKLIKAKCPTAWAMVIDQIEIDLNRLREAFPNDITRQGDLIKRGKSHVLQSKKLPISMMELTLNVDGECVEIAQASKRDRTDQSIFTPKEPIKFRVDEHGELILVWEHREFTDLTLLAERLIKSVCGIAP